MMPTFPTWLVVLHMVVVLLAVLAVLLVTESPLGLFGLLFMPKVPFLVWSAMPGGGQVQEPSETDARSIGFHAEMGDELDEE